MTDQNSTLSEGNAENLSMSRNVKISLFHVGSSMADILTAGVWNRIAITELGLAATPIALLLSLRYFLAPLSVWVGQRSDVSNWRGYRRLQYIWGGRLLMVLSYFLLALATVTVADDHQSALGWIGMIVSLILFSVGSAFSGTTYLALLYDVTPKAQQTRAISVVWSFLIIGFAIAGLVYSKLLPTYTRDGFLALFLIAPLIMGVLWFVSLLGEEKPIRPSDKRVKVRTALVERRPFWDDLRGALVNGQTRVFFAFLALSTMFFYMQDSILEPFAGQVFNMPPATTNRFSSYWGTMALIGIVSSLFLVRRYPKRINNTVLSRWGVIILLIAFGLFGVCAIGQIRVLVTISLIVLGLGLGAWTVGTLGLMMDMTRTLGAGLYLSLWTVSETLARGVGTVLGGVLRDVTLAVAGQFSTAYGAVFLVEAVGFALTMLVLSRVDVGAFHQESPATTLVLEAAMD